MAETLQRTRAGHVSRVTCQENNTRQIFEKDPSLVSNLELSKLKFSLKTCKEQQEKIECINKEIIDALEAAQANVDSIQSEQDKIDTIDFKVGSFIQALEDLIVTIEEAPAVAVEEDIDRDSTHPMPRNISLKLPKISLPTFSGKYNEWTPFYDLFKNTVDCNRALSDIQKLQYLKTSLKEQPARLLSHLPTTNANYQVALTILKERYDNKRMII